MFELNDFKALDMAAATISLWVFKTSGTAADPRFNGHWVQIGNDVKEVLKNIVNSERGRITEVSDYSLLASTNEASALSISSDVTFVDRIETVIAAELPQKRANAAKKTSKLFFLCNKNYCRRRDSTGCQKNNFKLED